MVKLWEYKDKDGYYLKGYVNGNTTLQVHPIAADLFDWLEFQVGDSIPKSLTYGLLDFGLLYTKDPNSSPGETVEFKQNKIKSELNQRQYQRFVGFIKSYDNSPPESIRALVERLNTRSVDVNPSAIPNRRERDRNGDRTEGRDIDHGRFSGIVDRIFTKDEPYDEQEFRSGITSNLKEWGIAEDAPEVLDEQLDRSFAAAVEYPFDITDVALSEHTFSYKTILPAPSMWQDKNNMECAISVPLKSDTDAVQVEVLIDHRDPLASPERVDNVCLHKVVNDVSQGIIQDWTTVVSEESSTYEEIDQATLLSQQALVLDCLTKAADLHPQLVIDMPLSAVEKFLVSQPVVDSELIADSTLIDEDASATSSGNRAKGIVDFFNDTGGYGFIETDASAEDVFFHMEDVGGPDLNEGQEVKFGIKSTEKGPRATDLERV